MRVKEKLYMEQAGLIENGPITIVAFGDSVTHGALRDVIDYEEVYWNRLRKKLNKIRGYVPVNVICAGIGGTTAEIGVKRIDDQVLRHKPDLIIVCFGLNDVAGELETYTSSLRTIFEKSVASGAEVIFMTPNMLNTYVADDGLPGYDAMGERQAGYQVEGGRMDTYMNAAKQTAKECGVKICDCYGKWKNLSRVIDTTKLLDNRLNHPIASMHELFADSLLEVIMADE